MTELVHLKNIRAIYMPTYLPEMVIFDTNYLFQNNQRELSTISILYLGKRGKVYLRLRGSGGKHANQDQEGVTFVISKQCRISQEI